MSQLPFYIVPLTHSNWENALACAKKLPKEAMPEVRLDLMPDADPEQLVYSLKHHCIVSCRKVSDGGKWPDEDEAERLEKMKTALKGKPQWIDLEWDMEIPAWMELELMHTRLLRSCHAAPGVFDIKVRLQELPRGDAYKWVGHSSRLAENAYIKDSLAWAKDHRIVLSAFLMGNKGIVSRCMQAAWGGCFTYAAPDDALEAAPGQLKLDAMLSWKCHRLHKEFGICGVLGSHVLQSAGPVFHNRHFQQSFKDLIYLPLVAETPEEARDAMEALSLLGVSVTMPLKETLPTFMGLPAPLNTLWRRSGNNSWQWANTDADALNSFLTDLKPGPVLVLGSGGVAKTSMHEAEKLGWPAIMHSRHTTLTVQDIANMAPVGVIQATSLGMGEEDPLPFPDILSAAQPTLRWAIDWVNCENTAFSAWACETDLKLVSGTELFEKQATLQNHIFVKECGGMIV